MLRQPIDGISFTFSDTCIIYLIGYTERMNPIRKLRTEAGVTQSVLAARAGTSQPTIALYESGAKSPTLATLQRLADSLGLELAVTYVPRMTREDRRSLAYHTAVAGILRQDPVLALARAKLSLERAEKIHPDARNLWDQWRRWLLLPVHELISNLLHPGMEARDMRQVSPFSGILGASERARVLREFRSERGS
jgi:transcriptional regulator with XRE-family HTH domain